MHITDLKNGVTHGFIAFTEANLEFLYFYESCTLLIVCLSNDSYYIIFRKHFIS